MKITGSAKPERDRTFPGCQNDSPSLQDDIKDRRVLTNVHGNREASKKTGVRIELEISNSGGSGRCGEVSGQRLTLTTGVSKQENAVDESAV